MRVNNTNPARPLPLVRKSRHALGGEESAVASLSTVASIVPWPTTMAGGGCVATPGAMRGWSGELSSLTARQP